MTRKPAGNIPANASQPCLAQSMLGALMDIDPLTIELRRFILTYAEHDPDCLGINGNAWEEQKQVCVCGLAPRLDELLGNLDERLARHLT